MFLVNKRNEAFVSKLKSRIDVIHKGQCARILFFKNLKLEEPLQKRQTLKRLLQDVLNVVIVALCWFEYTFRGLEKLHCVVHVHSCMKGFFSSFANYTSQAPHMNTVFIHLQGASFFTRKYTWSNKICSKLGVRLVTMYFRATKCNFLKFPQ